jgi:hypothetical protein
MPANAYAPPASAYGAPPSHAPSYGAPPSHAPSYGPPQGASHGSLPPLGWQSHAGHPGNAGYANPATHASQKARSSTGAWVAGGAVAACLALLVAGGAVWAFVHPSHKPLPVEAAKLPSDTDYFQQDRFAGADDPPAVRHAFLASNLARHVCGAGSDFAQRLMQLRSTGPAGANLAALEAMSLFDPKTIEARREALACGESLVDALESPSFTELVFHDGDEKTFLTVEMLQLTIAELPAKFGFAKQSFAGFSGYCLIGAKPTESSALAGLVATAGAGDRKSAHDGECRDGSLAAFHDGPKWFFGARTAIDAFARSYSKPKKDLSTTVSNLRVAFDSTEGLAVRRADARPKAASSLLSFPCSFAGFESGAGSSFVEECMPKAVEKNVSSIDAKVRAVTYELAAPLQDSDGVRINLFFVARDRSAAKEVESELQDATRDWKSAIDNNEGKLAKRVHDAPHQLGQRKWSVALDPFVRAIRTATISRSGRVVELHLAEPFTAREKKEMREVMSKTSEDAEAAAAITQAMLKSQPVPAASLATLIGADGATRVLDRGAAVKLPAKTVSKTILQ